MTRTQSAYASALLVVLLSSFSHAQDAPAPPPPAAPTADAPTAEPGDAAAPAAVAVPAPVATPTAEAAPRTPGLLVLPPEFMVYQQSVGATEAVPEWTEAAQANLRAAASAVLSADSRFEVRPMPDLTPEQAALLREHVELFKVISMNVEGVVKLGGKPWQGVRDAADFRVGQGLDFLRASSGADYAFVIAGAEVRQTGGSIFMQLALAGVAGVYVPGGGTYMYAGVIDLRTGQVTWYNSSLGVAVFGMGGAAKTDQEAGAAKAIAALFKTYPESPGLKMSIAAPESAPVPAPAADPAAAGAPAAGT